MNPMERKHFLVEWGESSTKVVIKSKTMVRGWKTTTASKRVVFASGNPSFGWNSDPGAVDDVSGWRLNGNIVAQNWIPME